MIVLLDTNIFFSALISPIGAPCAIYEAWLRGRFRLVTCQQQIDEIRIASRKAKLRLLLHPNEVGTMLLDTNIFFSALPTLDGPPGRIYREWRSKRFDLVTSTEQLDELRKASRNPKFQGMIQPHDVGMLINLMHRAIVYGPIPRKHQAADPTDSCLLDRTEAAQPGYAVTGYGDVVARNRYSAFRSPPITLKDRGNAALQ